MLFGSHLTTDRLNKFSVCYVIDSLLKFEFALLGKSNTKQTNNCKILC